MTRLVFYGLAMVGLGLTLGGVDLSTKTEIGLAILGVVFVEFLYQASPEEWR